MNASPIGTITVFTRRIPLRKVVLELEQDDGQLLRTVFIECGISQSRFIKASHHGHHRQRWRPFARYWWEQNVGAIPEGFGVYHADGDSMNDSPSNLVLRRGNPIHQILASNPRTATKHVAAVKRSNKRRHREIKAAANAILRADAWYLVCHGPQRVVMKPHETKKQAESRKFINQVERWLAADGLCPDSPVSALTGAEFQKLSRVDGPLEGYRRYIPRESKSPEAEPASQREPDRGLAGLLAALAAR